MAKLTVILFCISNFGYIIGSDPLADKYGQLQYSTVLYRHGDRSIEYNYPTDPYANISYWPMGLGQITPAGIEKHYKLGLWLRNRYSDWLPEVYSPEDVYVRSSDYDRTIMSAEANLAGMYPPVGPKNLNGLPGKHIQFIPIHTVPIPQDNVVAMEVPCAMYSQESEKVKSDLETQQFYAQYDNIYEYMENNANPKKEEDMENFKRIADTLYYSLTIESEFNYSLPKWTQRIFPEPLLTIVGKNLELSTHNAIMKRLKVGPLLNEILTHMNEKRNGFLNPNRKLWIYSGHDITIIGLLNTMQLYEYLLVPYAAALMIELRLNTTGNYVVTVSYRNTSEHEPYLLHVPGCDSVACEFDQFMDILTPFKSVDWDEECKINNNTIFFIMQLLLYVLAVISTIAILGFILYVIAYRKVSNFLKINHYETR